MKILSSILALAICMSAFAQEVDITESPQITVTGSGTVYATPDEALLSFSVINSNDDIQVARQENQKISAEVITYLKQQGIADKHIQTQYMRVGKRHRNSHADGNGKYEASQSISICIDDLTRFEDIMAGLLATGVNNLGSPTFRSTELQKHKDEARKKAVASAKRKAQLLATELGQSIGDAIIIQEGAGGGINRQGAYANFGDSAPSGGSEAGFAPGQLEVKSSVTVSFRLFQK